MDKMQVVEIILAGIEQQMPPEQIVQQLVQAGLSQEDAVNNLEVIMQAMSQGATADQIRQEVGGGSAASEQAPSQQEGMSGGIDSNVDQLTNIAQEIGPALLLDLINIIESLSQEDIQTVKGELQNISNQSQDIPMEQGQAEQMQ